MLPPPLFGGLFPLFLRLVTRESQMIAKGIVGVFELLIPTTLANSDCFKDLLYRLLFLFHFDDGGVAWMLFLEVCNNSIVLCS